MTWRSPQQNRPIRPNRTRASQHPGCTRNLMKGGASTKTDRDRPEKKQELKELKVKVSC